MSTTRRSIALTKPQLDFLKKEGKRLGITVADVVRRIVDEYRERKETKTYSDPKNV